jgi:uncharacterized tellurite resistance protein B-like protein
MIDRIRSLFTTLDRPGTPDPGHSDEDKRLAAAVLLVEAAVMDGNFSDQERAVINPILGGYFGLTEEESETLIAEAALAQDDANHLIAFTRVLKEAYPIEERTELVEMLWEVVYADGVLHDYEANLLRRVSGLLYVSDREQGDARKRVLDRIIPSPASPSGVVN